MAVGRFIGGIAALIWSETDDTYLLLRRSSEKDFASGVWECVTGRVDQGEGFEEALKREVQEELGVEAEILYFLGTTHFYRGSPHPENELIGIVCCCRVQHPQDIHLSAEHSEGRWLTAAQARALLSSADQSTSWILRVIERAEAIKRLIPPELRRYFREAGMELG